MVSDKQRHQALQRALKMNILFKAENYDDIMQALNGQSANRKQEFMDALPASLVQAEKDWLWNYLRHCTKTGEGGWGKGHPGDPEWLPEAMAASVGW